MKKIVKLLLIVCVLFVTTKAYASSIGISASSTNCYTGDRVTVTVRITAGAWNVTVSGAVSDKIVGYDMDGNKTTTKTYTIDTSSAGSKTITITGDITDYDTDVKTDGINKSVTINISPAPEVPTTTRATTQRTTKQQTTTTQVSTTEATPDQGEVKGEEETTTPGIVENPITNIKVVGYDIKYDKNKTEYEIYVSKNVTALYIMVEGNNLESASPGEVDIRDKDVIDVTVPVGDKTFKYTFKINRTSDEESEKIIKGLTATLIIMCLVMVVIVCLSVFVIFGLKKRTVDNTIIPLNEVNIDNNNQNM